MFMESVIRSRQYERFGSVAFAWSDCGPKERSRNKVAWFPASPYLGWISFDEDPVLFDP